MKPIESTDRPHRAEAAQGAARRRRIPELLLAFVVIGLFQALVFRDLIRHPSSLIADADRPSRDSYRHGVNPVGNDLTRLFLPIHLAIADQVKTLGRVTTWDDRGFCGRPLVGNPQSSLFYPPVWLVWISGQPSGLGWLTVMHLVWLGVGGFTLARTLGLSVSASLFAGVCLSANPYVLAQVAEGHYPHVWCVSWFPWAIGLIWRGGRRNAVLAAPCLALAFLAGHLQEWFYLNLAIGIAMLGVALCRKQTCRNRFVDLAITWSLTAALIAVELLPDLLARGQSLRGDSSSLNTSSRYALGTANLLQLLDPLCLGGPSDYRGIGNYWETVLSIGLMPLVFVSLALAHRSTRRAAGFWVAALFLCLAFGAGPWLGVYPLLYYTVPWIDAFRVPARSLFLAMIPAAILVGVGVDRFRKSGLKFAGPLAVILTLAGTVELAWHASRVIVISGSGRWFGVDPVGKLIHADAQNLAFRPRIRVDDAAYGDLDAIVAQLEKTNVGDSFQLDRMARLYRRLYRVFDCVADDVLPRHLRPSDADLDRLARVVLDLLSVDYLVAPGKVPTVVEDWPVTGSLDWRGSRWTVLRNPSPLPRAYLVGQRVAPASVRNPVEDLLALDSRQAVLLADDRLPAGPRQAFRPVELKSSGPDQLEMNTTLEAPGYLVLTQAWAPGWQATVNGRPSPVVVGNVGLCVLPLSQPGPTKVALQYVPPGFRPGILLSGVGVVAWIWAFVATRRVISDKCS